MRIPMIAGNWKLHNDRAESVALATQLRDQVANVAQVEIVIAPVFTSLDCVAKVLAGSPIKLAAQNCYPEQQGAFTGEVSPRLLEDAGCQYVIIGHSERRQLLGESDTLINRKARSLAATRLGTILCLGETLDEREAGQMYEVLRHQLQRALADLSAEAMSKVVLAYEPVWAIGTGKTASNDQAQDVHAFIRGLLGELYDTGIADTTRILYGGSVKPDNIDGLMAQADVDGALVGGASLKASDFTRIVKFQKA